MTAYLLALATLWGGPPAAQKAILLADSTFLEQALQFAPANYHGIAEAFVAVQPSRAIPQGRVPVKVMAACKEWPAKILREPYASKLAAARWTGYPNDRHMDEPLVASVALPEAGLSWSDRAAVVDMILDLGANVVPQDEEAREVYLSGVLATYLKLRDFPANSIRWFVPKLSVDLHGLWIGTLDRGLSNADNGALHARLGWDCCIKVMTDGRYVGIQVNAREDEPSGGDATSPIGSARPWKPADGYPKKSRFDE